MLHEAKNAGFVGARRLLGRRLRFVAGTVACERSLSRRAHAELARSAAERPVAVAAVADSRRRYWWFRGRFWWEEDDLVADDVMALALERERRRERRLDRARAGLAGGLGPPAGSRPGIPLEVKRAVWQRCGGRCVECGADSLLEFDHLLSAPDSRNTARMPALSANGIPLTGRYRQPRWGGCDGDVVARRRGVAAELCGGDGSSS